MRPNRLLIIVALTAIWAEESSAQETPANESAANSAADPETVTIRRNLRRISIAARLHEETLRSLPPVRLPDGTPDAPQLSWRVHLLPFLGEPELYEAFHFDEPWNSPHNRRLLPLMPPVYQIPSGKPEKGTTDGLTRFQAFAGPSHLFSPERLDRLDQIPGGASQTILAVTTGAEKAVPWTRPDTLTLPEKAPFTAFGVEAKGQVEAILADGRLIALPSDMAADTLLTLASAESNASLDSAILAQLLVRESVRKPGPDESAHHRVLAAKLRQLGLAMHNYHDTFRQFPLVAQSESYDETGRPLLSWRVHLLPFLDQTPLYKRFHLDEPWNSEHNRKLMEFIPEVLRSPTDEEDAVTTRFVLVTGERALFSAGGSSKTRRPRLSAVRDGSSSTLMIVQAGRDRAVPWTAPQDTDFDRFNPLTCLGTPPASGWPVVLTNADVRMLTTEITPQNFSALVTPAGGEILRPSEIRKQLVSLSVNSTSPANRMADSLNALRKNMSRIGIAMFNYHDVHRAYPIGSNPKYFDGKGKPKLSWRVHLLPFLEQEPLYRRFNLYEPWDSAQNRPLLKLMPDVYRSPGDADDVTKTRFQTLTGPLGCFNVPNGGPRRRDIRDGSSNTLLVVQVGADKAVSWTQPVDAEVDEKNPLACLGQLSGPAFVTLMADGAVRTWQTSISATLFRALATPRGGELLKSSELRAAQVP